VIKVTVTRINARSSARQPRSVVVRVPGPQGFKGNTGTSQLGEVVVLNPNQPPAVSQTGTPENAVYNFSLPRTPEFTVRSTTASAPGGDAVAFAEGDSSGDVLFDFILPRGNEGPQGIQGIQGIQGDAATVDVGTVAVVNPDRSPDVSNSGTTSDAVLDFDLPRAPAVSVGSVTTVGPADFAAVTDSGTDGDVVLDFDIPQGVKGDTGDTGPQGDTGVEISAVEPENLTVLWADTSEEGDAVLPLGGAAGQSLVKVSGDDYDTTWADLDTDGVSEGTVNLYNRVPAGGAAGQVLTKASETDYDAAWRGYNAIFPTTGLISGRFYGNIYQMLSQTRGMTLDLLEAHPFVVPVQTTFDRIAIHVVNGQTSSVVRLGIYSHNATLDYPGALVLDAGTVSATSGGFRSITISETLSPGIYWLAAVHQEGTTAPNIRGQARSWVPFSLMNDFYGIDNADPQNCAVLLSGVSGALPDPFGTPTGLDSRNARIQLRAA
jgi:hypothetical protein